MINYTDKENIEKLLLLEKNSLEATLDIQRTLNRQILVFMKNFIGSIELDNGIGDETADNKAYMYLSQSTQTLNNSNANIANITKLLDMLEDIKESSQTLSPSKLKPKIEAYNKKFTTILDSVFKSTKKIESFLHETSTIDLTSFLEEISNSKKSKKESQIDPNIITSDELDSGFIENTLIISEIRGKVIFPYNMDKVQDILLANGSKFNSLQNVIDRIYTKPIKYYKGAAFSRFREAYRLMRRKEHSSIFRALSLASELFMNYNLHPAIITACKNIDQLDIYLACLEDDTLSEFKFFNIKYEVAPKLT